MKRNFVFIVSIIIILAFVWLVTSIGLQYNKSKSNNLNIQNEFFYNIQIDFTKNSIKSKTD